MKELLAALAAFGLIGAALPKGDPASTAEGIPAETMPEVVRIQCGNAAGTAFYVSPTNLLSVAHVTSLKGCSIDGEPFKVLRQEGDFAFLSVDTPVSSWLRVDCSGFKAGEKYTAWGFARGLHSLTSVDITATGQNFFGFSRLWGVFNVIPGQSGGPLTPVNDPKHVVGTVNVFNANIGDSGSVALKDTFVCRS